MSKATSDALEALHGDVAEVFSKALEPYKENPKDIPASLMATIVKFLKDNHIEAVPTPGSPLGELTEKFPFETEVNSKH